MPGGAPCEERGARRCTVDTVLSVRPSVQGSRAGGSPTDKRDNKRLAPRYREEEEEGEIVRAQGRA